jgi:dihydrolipoamide dehydrogenase
VTEPQHDLIVIGAGPGGYVAAIRAAQLGMRVACVEKDQALGGTCLNVGCIPSKALLDSSERYFEAKEHLAEHGVKIGDLSLDLSAMMKRKDGVVGTLNRGVAALFKKNGVEHVRGSARIVAAGTVEVGGKSPRTLRATRILIATGSVPIALPALPFDGKRIVSSTEALCLDRVPGRMIVVGAGAIGLELGSVWSRLGTEVTVVELLSEIAPGADHDAAEALRKALERQGLRFLLESTVAGCEVKADGVSVTLEAGRKQRQERFDVVLVAVGRRAYTEGLGLESVGARTDERGRIVVDESFRAGESEIYAIGDAIAGPMLAHKAQEEGVAAVERMAGVAGHVNYAAIPSVIYTWPELAFVGLTERQASARPTPARIGRFPFRASGRARCSGAVEGLCKIIADAETDRVLGIHLVGPSASELIAEGAIAVEFSASAEDIARSVHAHPTLAEALKEAALAVDGRAIHV